MHNSLRAIALAATIAACGLPPADESTSASSASVDDGSGATHGAMTSGATDIPAAQSTGAIDSTAGSSSSGSTSGEVDDHVTFTIVMPGGFACATYEALAYKSCDPNDQACVMGPAFFGDPIVCQEDAETISVDVFIPGIYLLEVRRTDEYDGMQSYFAFCFYQLGPGDTMQAWFEVTEIDLLQGDEFIVDMGSSGSGAYVPCYETCAGSINGCYPQS